MVRGILNKGKESYWGWRGRKRGLKTNMKASSNLEKEE